MENDIAAKASYQKQSDEARANYKKLAAIAREKQDRKYEAETESYKVDPDLVKKRDEVELAAFLATGTLHKEPRDPVDLLADPFFDDLIPPSNSPKQPDEAAIVAPNSTWKLLASEANGFSVMMPPHVDVVRNIYTAKDQNISYAIYASGNAESPLSINENAKLSTAAWAIATGFACNFILIAHHVCDVSPAGKADYATHPALAYHVKETNCDGVTPGFIKAISTKDHIYVLYVYGVDENDPRAKRFLESLKLTGK